MSWCDGVGLVVVVGCSVGLAARRVFLMGCAHFVSAFSAMSRFGLGQSLTCQLFLTATSWRSFAI